MFKRKFIVAAVPSAVLALASCSAAQPSSDVRATRATASGSTAVAQRTACVPRAARRYVAAVNANDLDSLVRAFAPDGRVVDVSRVIRGRPAIRQWAAAEVMGGSLRVLGCTPTSRGARLRVHWAPGGSDGWEAIYTYGVGREGIVLADLQYA